MFNHILERGTLTSSQGQAAIRLIPKCQDACGVSDFRPISLLNCDYKIMASVLARRLRHTLPDTIGPHQKEGVPGRLIFDNLCLYRDVIQYVDDRGCHDSSQPSVQGIGNAIVGVDFEKAYDLVNRDGCPLSMHLFVLYIEPLLVRLSHELQGIRFFNQKLVVRALVDDVTIFVSCDNDLVIAGKVLELFCQWTKARMNKQKTKALGLERWRNRVHWPLPWLTSTEILPLLGIKFSSSISETADRVWNHAFGHLQGRIERPQRSVVYRPVNQGGLGMINTTLFYRSLFLCPIYKVLTGPDSPESSLLRFWLSFPLRNMLQLYNRNKPAAVILLRNNCFKSLFLFCFVLFDLFFLLRHFIFLFVN
ncbi:hypothetical protein GHT06_001740 [Daphnia sinensis]|uniref:Reverse transcriptase domain-containing protein n=1 Tax=Daphnia sinensis TaxID=1820382 RepID=A0AAD5KV17_9CRUS|nr:hypothetical protein GHT06_001740 [Daphnia sinensis]